MSRIVAVDVVRRRLPVRGLDTTYGPGPKESEYVYVRVSTEDGACGFGEAACLTQFTGETPRSVEVQIQDYLGPLLIGEDALAIEALHARVRRALPHNPTALAAVDVALYDLVGKLFGRPVGDLIGGRIHKQIPTADGIGIDSPERAADQARQLMAQGAAALKLKVGVDLDRDLQAVAAVREAVGPTIPLRLDANGGLTVAEAVEFARAVVRYRPQYFEQPVPGWDLEGLAEVRRRSPVPIAADEACTDLHSVIRILQLRAADYIVIKLIKAGGLTPARQILRLAALYGVRCTITSPFETTIGVAANLHLAATADNLSGPVEVGVPMRRSGDPAEGLTFREGAWAVPEEPGLGVTVEPDLFAPVTNSAG